MFNPVRVTSFILYLLYQTIFILFYFISYLFIFLVLSSILEMHICHRKNDFHLYSHWTCFLFFIIFTLKGLHHMCDVLPNIQSIYRLFIMLFSGAIFDKFLFFYEWNYFSQSYFFSLNNYLLLSYIKNKYITHLYQ